MRNLGAFYTYLLLFFSVSLTGIAREETTLAEGAAVNEAKLRTGIRSGQEDVFRCGLLCGSKEEGVGRTKLVVLKKEDLGSNERLLAALTGLSIKTEELSPESRRAIDIIVRKNFKPDHSTSRTIAETFYAILGMVSGTGVTWNAYAHLMAEDYFGIPGTYEKYTASAGVPAEDWAFMLGINLNTHTFLYIVNGAQMGADASAFFDKVKYSRSYDWGKSPESHDTLGNIGYYGWHISSRMAHPFLELLSPTLPRVTHWSENIVDPLLTTVYAANVIPEMGIVVGRLLEIMRINTLLGVPLAFMQRWNEQSRRMSSAIHQHYYSRLARAASSEEINKKRKILSKVIVNFISRIRNKSLSTEELEAVYEVLYGRDKSRGPRIIGEARSEITDEGLLGLIAAYGAGVEDSYDPDYQEPLGRKITSGLGAAVGFLGSISSGIVVKQTVNAALLGINFTPENADSLSTSMASVVGLIRAGSGANNTSQYFKRMYDSLTDHEYYRETGIFNPHFSDVVYGRQESLFLLSNLMEGCYWSLIYWALSDIPMDALGIEEPWKGMFIGATVMAQGAFEAMESSDDLQLFQHYANRMRASRGTVVSCLSSASTWIWDTIFCCSRGRWRCTRDEWPKDTPREAIKDSIHLFKALESAKEIKELMEVAKPEVVDDMYKLMVRNNPLLELEGDYDEETGASATPVMTSARGVPALMPSSPSPLLASAALQSASAGGRPVGSEGLGMQSMRFRRASQREILKEMPIVRSVVETVNPTLGGTAWGYVQWVGTGLWNLGSGIRSCCGCDSRDTRRIGAVPVSNPVVLATGATSHKVEMV